MNKLQILKKSMLAYVQTVKFIWSKMAHPLSIIGKKFMNLRGYRIYGNMYQSPVGGKNLFDISKIVGNTNLVNNNDGTLTLKNIYSISTSTKLSSACPTLKIGDTITFSAKSIVSDGSNSYKAIYLGTSKSYWYFNNSYTVTESDLNSKLYFYNATSTTAANLTTTISDIQIEIGGTATEYEPYIPAPSPEYPSEIESVGDLTEKNLFDKTKIAGNATIVEGTDDIIVTDSGGLFLNHVNTITMLNPSTTYTISFDIEIFYVPDDTIWKLNSGGSGGWFGVLLYSSVNNAIRMIASNVKEPVEVGDKYHVYKVFTTSDGLHEEDANFLMYSYGGNYVKIDGTSGYASGKAKISNFQIRKGEYTEAEMNDYEPYHKYKIPVVARGRNLIPMFTFKTFTSNGVTFTNNNDGSITLNGTPTGYAATPVISLPESSLEVLRNNACVLTGFYKTSSSNVSMGIDVFLDSTLVKQYYISTSSSANYIKVDLRSLNFNKINLNSKRDSNDKLIDNVTVKPFLEVGTTMPTSFEPYIAPVTTNVFLNEPLRKIGKYVDYVDSEKQKVIRNIKSLNKLNGTPVQYGKVVVIRATSSPLGVGAQDDYSKTAIRCSHIKGGSVSSGVIFSNATGRDVQFYLSDCGIDYTSETALDEFKALVTEWTASGKFQMHYAVATPIEENVNLPVLPQFKGTTIYEIQTDIKPSSMEAKYC